MIQILVPGGRKCYCGKSGCADAYCAASVLTQNNRQSLDAFMEKIESGDEKVLQTWNEYLDHLAVLISNLRMAYDMDIILVGDVGGVLLIFVQKIYNSTICFVKKYFAAPTADASFLYEQFFKYETSCSKPLYAITFSPSGII